MMATDIWLPFLVEDTACRVGNVLGLQSSRSNRSQAFERSADADHTIGWAGRNRQTIGCRLAAARIRHYRWTRWNGKSSVALAVAAELMGNYQNGIFWVDLTSIETPDLVPSKVADVLGVETRPEDVLSDLMAALKDMDVLLVLDNCEHLVPPLPP